MKQYWQSLNERQQWIFIGCSLAVVFLFIYLCVVLPMQHRISQLKNEVLDKKDLVVWINQYQNELEQLRKLQPIIKKQSNKTLLTLVEQSLKQKALSSAKADLQQTKPNEVQVIINQVEFDVLIKWIDNLWQDSGILLQQISINPTEKLGLVKVTVVFSKKT